MTDLTVFRRRVRCARLAIAAVSLLVAVTGGPTATEAHDQHSSVQHSMATSPSAPNDPVNITKFTFLIHPVSWELQVVPNGPNWHYFKAVAALRGGAYYPPSEFDELLARERDVNRRQLEYIKAMGPSEAIVIFPIGDAPRMMELIRVAREHLGPRAIVVESAEPTNKPAGDYRKLFSPEIKTALMDEVIQSVQDTGYGWTAHGLKVLLYNRMVALEIEKKLAKAELHYDPARVEAVAFGEGFEQCAMSWKSLLGHYLGFAKPIESDYNLSVSGMPLLIGSTFKEVIKLENNVRLYLWQLRDGRSLAFYAQASTTFAAPPLFVTLQERGQIYSELGALLHPKLETLFSFDIVKRSSPAVIRMPVFDGKRMYQQQAPPVAQVAYFVAEMPYEQFRDVMLKSPIGE